MLHTEKNVWCRMVRRLNKRRSNKQKSKKARLVAYVFKKSLSDNYLADYGQLGPIERDPWPTPVNSAANSEANSVYSDSSALDSEDEDEESQLETGDLEIEEMEAIDPIDPIDPIDEIINEFLLSPPNIDGIYTNLSRTYPLLSLPSQAALYFG